MWIKLLRTFKAGIQNFWRNKWLSVATICVILIAIFVITVQTGVVVANNLLLEEAQDRVSISVYFNPDTSEGRIKDIKDDLLRYKEIKEIEHISSEDALIDFEKRTEGYGDLQETLKELGSNPFEDTLNIKAYDPSQYEVIANSIENGEYKDSIASVNYFKYKSIIDGLSGEIKSNQRVGFLLGITLSVIAILITFNSVMVTIYSYRKEIEIMKLVGGSRTYIQLPFIWEGVMFGFIAGILAAPLSYIYLRFISSNDSSGAVLPFSNSIYIQQFLSEYFLKNLALVILIQVAIGVFLGVVSSFIAVRKYLRENK
ncbi:MAG: permease-like cell division protein FtsX [Patescibacteria group bacterium]|jgi:cell division transport system permease protein|nr:permease-like cell division protein FtsX [Patescibacteria group bacterium]